MSQYSCYRLNQTIPGTKFSIRLRQEVRLSFNWVGDRSCACKNNLEETKS